MADGAAGKSVDLGGALAFRGKRVTAARRAIVSTIEAFDGPFSAGELTDAVRAADASVGRASVYRTLALLVREGWVRRLHGTGKERYTVCAERSHHHHVTCTDCGATEEFVLTGIDRFEWAVDAAVGALGYRPVTHVLEVYGLCPACLRRRESRRPRALPARPDAGPGGAEERR